MDFHLFMYCTAGQRAELEAGMAGQIAEYARFADHSEHHLHVEGVEISDDRSQILTSLELFATRMMPRFAS